MGPITRGKYAASTRLITLAQMTDLYSGVGGATPEALLDEIRERTGNDFDFIAPAEDGGSGGALYVRWPDGRDGVITRSPLTFEQMRQTADILEFARTRGLPVPRHDVITELADGTLAVIQERLPGAPARPVDASTIDAMAAVNDRFTGLLEGRPDIPVPGLYLRHSGPVFPRHEVLENYNERSRILLRRIREIGATGPDEMVGDDLVHPDLTFGNVLFDTGGQVTGVVDWNWGAGRGDRHFALMRIYVDLYWSMLNPNSRVEQSAFDRLDEVVAERIDPALLTSYWAHYTLNQLHWMILHHPPAAIDLFLRFGESRLI